MHPVWLHWERGLLEAWVCFLQDYAPCFCLFADIALHSFAIINSSCEYDHLLSSQSSPNKSLNLRVALVTTDTPDICESCPLHRWAVVVLIPKRGEISFFDTIVFQRMHRSSCHIKAVPTSVCLINRYTFFFIHMAHPKTNNKNKTNNISSFHCFKEEHVVLLFI